MTSNEDFARAAALLDQAPPAPRREPPDEERVLAALGEVIDPEIGLDIVTLGLVRRVEIDGGAVRVIHTLTTRGCPMEAVIRQGIEAAVGAVRGVDDVATELVWDPPWHPGMIREGAW